VSNVWRTQGKKQSWGLAQDASSLLKQLHIHPAPERSHMDLQVALLLASTSGCCFVLLQLVGHPE
jgi:hypothetical protein